MYAVIRAGGKQRKVQPGDVLEVEHVPAGGEALEFAPILVVDDEGKAHVGKGLEGAVVTARPVGEKKGEKVKVFRYRPKTGYARRGGHRQLYTLIEIQEVKLPKRAGRKRARAAERPPAEEPAAEGAAPVEEATPAS
jgi:large subunit ribosomal protein L21